VNHRVIQVNKALVYVYIGDTLIGSARKGLDNHWHPELPGSKRMEDAIAWVFKAHYALEEFRDAG
jgi:hypothetical protein